MYSPLMFFVGAVVAIAAPPAETRARDLYFTPTAASAPVSPSASTTSAAPVPAPLGLRYSLLKIDSGGAWREVSPAAVFTAGDRIRLTLEANQGGFIYVLHQGSSSEWYLMEGSPLAVEKSRRYEIPPGGRFYFDHQAGEEKLFFVLTRSRDASLDQLMGNPPATNTPPVPTRPAPQPPAAMQASARSVVKPEVIRTLHLEMQSRNLFFEKVDQSTTPSSQESAVYAVNTDAGNQARVVVELRLTHR
ncbi:MAG: hypothetical protein ACKV22_35710 [Bryobacteraceae bacterium]